MAGGLCPVHGFEGFLWRTGMAGLAGRNPPAQARGSSRLAKAAAAGDNFLEICPVPILFPMGAAQGLCQSKRNLDDRRYSHLCGDWTAPMFGQAAAGFSWMKTDSPPQWQAFRQICFPLPGSYGETRYTIGRLWSRMDFAWWRARMASCAGAVRFGPN